MQDMPETCLYVGWERPNGQYRQNILLALKSVVIIGNVTTECSRGHNSADLAYEGAWRDISDVASRGTT